MGEEKRGNGAGKNNDTAGSGTLAITNYNINVTTRSLYNITTESTHHVNVETYYFDGNEKKRNREKTRQETVRRERDATGDRREETGGGR